MPRAVVDARRVAEAVQQVRLQLDECLPDRLWKQAANESLAPLWHARGRSFNSRNGVVPGSGGASGNPTALGARRSCAFTRVARIASTHNRHIVALTSATRACHTRNALLPNRIGCCAGGTSLTHCLYIVSSAMMACVVGDIGTVSRVRRFLAASLSACTKPTRSWYT